MVEIMNPKYKRIIKNIKHNKRKEENSNFNTKQQHRLLSEDKRGKNGKENLHRNERTNYRG